MKLSSRAIDQTSQIMIGLLLLLLVGAVIGVVLAVNTMNKDEEEEEYMRSPSRRDDSRGPTMKLNTSLVVPPRRSIVYYLPDISQQRKPLEAFNVLEKNGKQ